MPIELPRCAACRVTVQVGQNVVFRADGRIQHAECPPVICPVCDREIRPPTPIRRDGDQIVRDPPVPVEARRSGHVLKRLLLEPGAPQQARSSPRSRRAPRLDDRVGEANTRERGLE